jgi:hypothetical protein
VARWNAHATANEDDMKKANSCQSASGEAAANCSRLELFCPSSMKTFIDEN